jgi:hypothetical protein
MYLWIALADAAGEKTFVIHGCVYNYYYLTTIKIYLGS